MDVSEPPGYFFSLALGPGRGGTVLWFMKYFGLGLQFRERLGRVPRLHGLAGLRLDRDTPLRQS